MRRTQSAVWLLSAALCLATCLTSCATTDTAARPFRTFFVPPRLAPSSSETKSIDPPDISAGPLVSAFYANEVPRLTNSLPVVPRPSDSEFLINRADEYFAAGKRAFQSDRMEEARRDFDR